MMILDILNKELADVNVDIGIIVIVLLFYEICYERCPLLSVVIYAISLIGFTVGVLFGFGVLLLYVVNHGL